jgi:hypothetical protein
MGKGEYDITLGINTYHRWFAKVYCDVIVCDGHCYKGCSDECVDIYYHIDIDSLSKNDILNVIEAFAALNEKEICADKNHPDYENRMTYLRNNKRIHEAVMMDIDPGLIKLEELIDNEGD